MVLGAVPPGAVARHLHHAERRPRARDGVGVCGRSRRLDAGVRAARAPPDPPRRPGGGCRRARGRAHRGMTYLFWSFAIVWIALYVYVRVLMRRTRVLEDEVRRLGGDGRGAA